MRNYALLRIKKRRARIINRNAEVSMAKKKKIIKLTDEQYIKYIMSLKDDAALYNADGEMFTPASVTNYEKDKTGE